MNDLTVASSLIGSAIPSPPQGAWNIGPLTIHMYGILIMVGMVAAVWITGRRYERRGGVADFMYEIALWAIPLGIIGARIYHVVSSPDAYFGPNGNPIDAFKIWNGGLGIWGGVALGAVGAYIALRRAGQRMGPLADSIAPALLVAQAIGRWGNWFNQELFGAPTTLPWGLQVDAAHMPAQYAAGTLFHPTFLYECLWNLVIAALIVWVDRRARFASGQVFGLYLMGYTLGRVWIEMLRVDEAQHILGLRLNVWTSIAVFLAGLAVFCVAGRPGRSTTVSEDEHEHLRAHLGLDKSDGADNEADESLDEEDVSKLADESGSAQGAKNVFESVEAGEGSPESRSAL